MTFILSLALFYALAGALLRNHIRHQLRRAEAHGAKWFETKGLLSSEFSVTAPDQIVQAIRAWLKNISEVPK